ncbi:FAD-dependent oxidoreductase [Streptomyces microflavus]|uniref:FAD-dependent oxidoreductase n=1 Tax=Streptomyces microflavus TaxID=1919 RepID=UPI00381551A8
MTTSAGRTLRADAIVLATGLSPRTLPGAAGIGGVRVLRPLADAQALRGELLAASGVVVVGDGVLDSEVTATVRQMGQAVTLAGPQSAPMAAQLGGSTAEHLAALHRRHGVELRSHTLMDELVTEGGRVPGGSWSPARGPRPTSSWRRSVHSGRRLADGQRSAGPGRGGVRLPLPRGGRHLRGRGRGPLAPRGAGHVPPTGEPDERCRAGRRRRREHPR